MENAQKFVTFHPRCGTSFLLLVMVLAILVYPLVPFDGFAAKLVARIALLPLIVGISYELIRYAARHQQGLMATLTAPGLVAAAGDHAAAVRRTGQRRHPRAGRRHAAGRSPGRRVGDRVTRSNRRNPPCNFRKSSSKSKRRFEELNRQMADPTVISDGESYRKIAKERSELEETVAKYREYKQAKRNSDEARSDGATIPIRNCGKWPPMKSRGWNRSWSASSKS